MSQFPAFRRERFKYRHQHRVNTVVRWPVLTPCNNNTFMLQPQELPCERAPKPDWTERGRHLLTSSQSFRQHRPVPVHPLTYSRGSDPWMVILVWQLRRPAPHEDSWLTLNNNRKTRVGRPSQRQTQRPVLFNVSF